MSPPDTPLLTDRAALERARVRARRIGPALFLHETAAEEVKFRASGINRTFTKIAIVTAFPEPWLAIWPEARIVPDADTLDFGEEPLDLVIHALALHWANDPVGQLVQSLRALKPDGLMLGVCLGGQTLHELRASLAEAEARLTGGLSPRVLPMGEIRDLGALLQRAGFALPVADLMPLRASYRDIAHLVSDLRAMGEVSALAARPRHASRRTLFAAAQAIYAEAFPAENDRIAATYELVFLTGWSPDASQQQPMRPGSASHSLSDILDKLATERSPESPAPLPDITEPKDRP